ncbi:MBL fold metallo-hydrolase [Anaerobacillus alkaliphilus]|uniref:MBL fold metallo-hydrolase n=1 Tax=Anaerobacillus alkaliphilus TaxID=1548597 RepID=A0A4Q0VXD6_9BACI|nr:MBL fold metallo-hydrolase [Anaerobacillus alkaliphilus]RXJ04052.1 MBL fold metallo-hydrolase [Anaerobacillus alkaliphilus]
MSYFIVLLFLLPLLLVVRKKAIVSFLLLSTVLLGCTDQPLDLPTEQTETKEEVYEPNEEVVEPEEAPASEETSPAPVITGEAIIHFIDVGQGDATLLQGPDFTILIDAGRHDREDVVPYLRSVGVETIDLLVGTHPHADHIGQMDKVINAFPVKEVWMSGDSHTTQTFERVLNAIIEHEVDYYEPRAGERFDIGSLQITVVNPVNLTGDFHEGSISLVSRYGEVSLLFTGDAEKQTEEAMLSRKEPIQAQIFQLGHHGSSTSNIKRFLEAVAPEVAIYSAGLDNSYGHPHREVIDRLNTMNIPVYGTIQNGTIIITTDGKTYEINANMKTKQEEKQPEKVETSPPPTAAPSGTCIDINTASLEQLEQITHIGPERAQQLVQLRPFKSVDELTKINGIGAGRLRDIKAEGLACVN